MMKKEYWVKLSRWNDEAVQAAVAAGADALWPPEARTLSDRGPEGLRIAGPGGEMDFETVTLTSATDVDGAAAVARSGRLVVVDCPDWRLIPWEGLVGQGRVLALAQDAMEAEEALTVLESGLSGVVLAADDPTEILTVGDIIRRALPPELKLSPARITAVTPVGMGDRVCVDAAALFGSGEGLLVGDQAAALFLVAAETAENPFTPPRPFRVNAGGVHHYVLNPFGRTNYLSELCGGSPILAVSSNGKTRPVPAGRIKIERRPLVRVSAEFDGIAFSISLQNAETVSLVGADGRPISLMEIGPGHEALVCLGSCARHLGREAQEWILER
jgi:3-dehydroquinate synthase II